MEKYKHGLNAEVYCLVTETGGPEDVGVVIVKATVVGQRETFPYGYDVQDAVGCKFFMPTHRVCSTREQADGKALEWIESTKAAYNKRLNELIRRFR